MGEFGTASDRRFRVLTESTPAYIFIFQGRRSVYVNPAAARATGYSQEELHEMDFWEIMHSDSRELVRQRGMERQRDGRPPPNYEVKICTKIGETRWLDFTAARITHRGRPAVLGTAFDISKRKEVEQQLRALSEDLEARVRQRTAELADTVGVLECQIVERKRAEKEARDHQATLAHVLRISTAGEMAGGLAHELGQPLGTIVNYAAGLASGLGADEQDLAELRTVATAIGAEALRAGEIIRRLRDLVMGNGVTREMSDINALVRRVLDLVGADATELGVEITCDLAGDLPMLEVDRIQIEQVVMNLLCNALDAIGEAEPHTPELSVHTRRLPDGMIEVSVVDSGAGFGVADPDRLFDAFYTTKSTGLGMGLSISRSIIRSHGGAIKAAAGAQGRGASIAFTLPVVVAD